MHGGWSTWVIFQLLELLSEIDTLLLNVLSSLCVLKCKCCGWRPGTAVRALVLLSPDQEHSVPRIHGGQHLCASNCMYDAIVVPTCHLRYSVAHKYSNVQTWRETGSRVCWEMQLASSLVWGYTVGWPPKRRAKLSESSNPNSVVRC